MISRSIPYEHPWITYEQILTQENNEESTVNRYIRNIFKRKISFLAIVSIMLLGVGGMLGLFYLGESLDRCASDYYNGHNFKDFEIISNMGVSDEDIERIAGLGSVSDAEGIFKCDVILVHEGLSRSVEAVSLTERISVPYTVQGEMPSGQDECAISYDVMTAMGIEVGDTVRIGVSRDELDGLIWNREFTVTGAVYHPDYVSRMTSSFLVLDKEAFDKSIMNDAYTGAFVKADVPDEDNVFSDNYLDAVSPMYDELKGLAGELAEERGAKVKGESESKYNDAKEEADKGLAEARDKLEDAEKEYSDGLASGRDKLEGGEDELKNGNSEMSSRLEDARNRLNSGETQLNDKLSDSLAQINEGEREADSKLDTALDELRRGESEYSRGVSELAQGQHKFDEGLKEIEVADARLKAAKDQLDSGRETYNRMLDEMDASLNDIIDAMDPTLLKFDNIIRRIDEAVGSGSGIETHHSWDEFKAEYEKVGGLKV